VGRVGGWDGREGKGGEGGREGEGRGGERREDVEGPGKWSAPGPVLALGEPGGKGKKRGRGRGGQLRPPLPKWAGYGPALPSNYQNFVNNLTKL